MSSEAQGHGGSSQVERTSDLGGSGPLVSTGFMLPTYLSILPGPADGQAGSGQLHPGSASGK